MERDEDPQPPPTEPTAIVAASGTTKIGTRRLTSEDEMRTLLPKVSTKLKR
jgi:hypothetical protein